MVTRDSVLLAEVIEKSILLVRGQKVMLNVHLAGLYAVEPRMLIQAVKRNRERFPEDFTFQLTVEEWNGLKSQFVTSSGGGLRRATPHWLSHGGLGMRAVRQRALGRKPMLRTQELAPATAASLPALRSGSERGKELGYGQ